MSLVGDAGQGGKDWHVELVAGDSGRLGLRIVEIGEKKERELLAGVTSVKKPPLCFADLATKATRDLVEQGYLKGFEEGGLVHIPSREEEHADHQNGAGPPDGSPVRVADLHDPRVLPKDADRPHGHVHQEVVDHDLPRQHYSAGKYQDRADHG